jgi:hypothetical protein
VSAVTKTVTGLTEAVTGFTKTVTAFGETVNPSTERDRWLSQRRAASPNVATDDVR